MGNIITVLRLSIFLIGVACLAYSSICFFRPESGIKLFQTWCKSINWKVEPINYAMEVRNTRLLGIIGIILSLALLCKGIFN